MTILVTQVQKRLYKSQENSYLGPTFTPEYTIDTKNTLMVWQKVTWTPKKKKKNDIGFQFLWIFGEILNCLLFLPLMYHNGPKSAV